MTAKTTRAWPRRRKSPDPIIPSRNGMIGYLYLTSLSWL
jgi:hypothetical protein